MEVRICFGRGAGEDRKVLAVAMEFKDMMDSVAIAAHPPLRFHSDKAQVFSEDFLQSGSGSWVRASGNLIAIDTA